MFKPGRTGPPGCADGPVGPPARWAATSIVERWSVMQDKVFSYREGGLYLNKLFSGAPEILVTPLLMGPVCLISQGRFEEPIHSCV